MKKFLAISMSVVLCALLLTASAFAANLNSATLADVSGGENLLNAHVDQTSVNATTEGNTNEGYANLFDGDTTTKFCTGDMPFDVTWKMDAAYACDAVIIATANDNSQYTGRNPSEWSLSGSTDGTNYTVIYSGTDADFDDVDFTYFLVKFPAVAAPYQYYQYHVEYNDANCFQASELILCGSSAAETTAAPETAAAPAETAAPETAAAVAAPAAAAATTTTAAQTSDVIVLAVIALVSAVAIVPKKHSK